MTVGWSVSSHLKTNISELHKILHMLLVAVAQSTSDDNASYYILSVMQMMLCFHVMWRITGRRIPYSIAA